MNTYSVLAVLLGVFCLILLWLLKITSECNKVLRKERLELVTENEKLEYFLSEYFLHVTNDEELSVSFSNILDNYIQGKELPKRFLYLVCGYSNCYRLMESTVLLEIDRLAGSIVNKNTLDGRKETLNKLQKLNDLIIELNETFKNRNYLMRHDVGMIQEA